MALTAGTRLGPYEIVAALGAGGMGEVYRATDTKLKRQVAVKILPPSLAADAERLARFQREAEVLASLNHPHIAAIYGLEDADGVKALVMELVEGEDLSQRIAGGAIPLGEALLIAKQIAEALEAAHEAGVIHRDLKPANIKVRPDGTVKVLDFGLAKAVDPAPTSNMSQSPTITTPAMMTGVGVLLGTAAYMSPEQARGKPVDARADIWAFGVVLFEMLTGRRPFGGETISDTLAAVLKTEPDWRALPPHAPLALRQLLRRTLEKDPRRRLRHIGDARIEIEDIQSGSQADGPVGPSASQGRGRLAWLTVALVSLIGVAALVWAFRPVPQAPEIAFEISTPPTSDPTSLAISPDGRSVVFAAASPEFASQLWLRPVGSTSARLLAKTQDAAHPFWSPDNRSVGFFAEGKLKRIDVDTGTAQVLANAPNECGGTWNRDGVILFAPTASGPIFRIPDSGGEPIAVTKFASDQNGHRFPVFTPDGRHFVFFGAGAPPNEGLYATALDGSDTHSVIHAVSTAAFASSSRLLFVGERTLFEQQFDPNKLVLTGSRVTVAEGLATNQAFLSQAAISASSTGSIVYRVGSAGRDRQFAWVDRSGAEVRRVGSRDSGGVSLSLSPNGRDLAFARTVEGNSDIWLLDIERGGLSRVTSALSYENAPVWSPRGDRIVFGSAETGIIDLYETSIAGRVGETLLLATRQAKAALDWSRDGRYILFQSAGDLWALPYDGDRKPFPVVQTSFDERDGQFSPDGRWIAYASNESGRFQIYVQPFPGPGQKRPVSVDGGAQPRWRADGKELFYIGLDQRLMAVPIEIAPEAQTFNSGKPVGLFPAHVGGAVEGAIRGQYLVSADGQRFLMSTLVEDTSPSPITIIVNWAGAQKQ